MNTEKAERLREIANRFPTRRLEEKFFLLSLADEESKPLELDDSEIEKEAKRRGYSEYKSPDSAIAYSTFIESSEWYRSSIRGLRKEELESPLLAEQSYQIADAMLNERTKKQSPLELSDLERFGVALLEWSENKAWEEYYRDEVPFSYEQSVKYFLQSPEFEKWSKETLKS